jgi:hypothetical protein
MESDTPDQLTPQEDPPDTSPPDATATSTTARPPARKRRGHPLVVVRWVLRGLLLVVALTCLVVLVIKRAPSASADPAAGDWALTITLADGANYGEALVYAGPVQEGTELADAARIEEEVTKALASRPDGHVLILVAGGVSLQEVERVRRLVNEARPDCHIHLGALDP